MNHPTEPWRTKWAGNTELDALLSRVREDKADLTGKNRNMVAYDCWRMFESLAERFKEESAMRDSYKRQSDAWRDKALELADQLAVLKREAACPCCKDGVSITGEPCQECHGKALASVAYETCRVHFKLLEEDCEKAIANLNRFARCTIGQPTPADVEWAQKWLADRGELA